MRPIKFRGRDKGGNLHYGFYYVDCCGNTCIAEGRGGTLIIVDEDSVAQLVGYDANGREVYEDDVLIDQKGREYTISDVIQVELFCGGVYEPLYSTRYKFTLKD